MQILHGSNGDLLIYPLHGSTDKRVKYLVRIGDLSDGKN
jgi:hypothetical protein